MRVIRDNTFKVKLKKDLPQVLLNNLLLKAVVAVKSLRRDKLCRPAMRQCSATAKGNEGGVGWL